MGEAHPRQQIMEDGWVPGEVWQQAPVDCLLNGMNPAEAHLMFGGNQMLQQQFRHRFHPPPHLVELPGSININLSIPPHSMVEANGQVQMDPGNGSSVGDPGSGNHSLPLDNRNQVLEDTDDATDEEDDDDGEDDEMSVNMSHGHDTQEGVPMTHIMNEDAMVQCQQVPVQLQGNLHQQQTNMMNLSDAHCHSKQLNAPGLLRQVNVMNGHEHLHSHPHVNNTMMPIFPEPVEFTSNEAQQTHMQNENSDPNIGFSVHGTMYLEGRIVLHLKQSNDSNPNNDGMAFSSCAEDHHKAHVLGCAVCRLNSPMSHGQDNHRSQKESHRHTVKGVFFTFEDCTIFELYPEQFNCAINANPNELKHPEPHNKMTHQSHQMPISYIPPNIQDQSHQHHNVNKRLIQPLGMENLTGGQQSIVVPQQEQQQQQPQQAQKPQSQDTEDDSWLDEFESAPEVDDELRNDDSTEDESNPVPDSSSCGNLLNRHHQNHEDTNEDDEDDDDDDDVDDEEYSQKLYHNNNDCSQPTELASNNQPESQGFQTAPNMDVVPVELAELPSDGNIIATQPIPDTGPATLITALRVEADESCQSTTIRSLIKMRNDLKTKMRESAEPIGHGKYRCPITSCAKLFLLKKTLKEHLHEDHASGNPYRCAQCGLQCTDEKTLKKHVCSIRRRMLLLKRPGSKSFKSSKSLKNSRKQKKSAKVSVGINGDKPKVQQSVNSFGLLENISNNRKMFHTGKKINEPECDDDEDFSSGQENENDGTEENSADDDFDEMQDSLSSDPVYTGGRRERRMSRPFKCDICGKSFTLERRLESHKLSHGVERTSQCEKCGKRFARKDKLMRHMFVHNEEKMFSCDTCQKKFSRRDKLTDHLKSHGGADGIHNCPMCQKQFLRPDILKQHVKLHGMGNKHQCPECLRFVTGQDRLQKHMARHEEAKAQGQTLLCPLCTKYFIQRQSLKAHIKKFHPDADFDMDVSTIGNPPNLMQGNSTGSDEGLELDDNLSNNTDSKNGHIDSIEKTKPYSCIECGKRFAKRPALRKHLKKHTAPEELEPCSPNPSTNLLHGQDDSEEAKEPQIDICGPRSPGHDLAIIEPPSPTQMHAPSSCLLMSYSSQMGSSCSVSSSSSSSPPVTAIVEPSPAHTILPTHPLASNIPHFSINPHHHHHHISGNNNAMPAHIPLSLATAAAVVSVGPTMVSSSMENGILSLGSSQGTHLPGHGVQTHHHLLHHSQNQGHSGAHGLIHPPIAHPQGHIQAHLGHMPLTSMQHHVNVSMAQQTMCGSPYVIYPHYPYQ